MVTIIQRPTKQITYYGFECSKCGCKFTADEEDINVDTDIDNGIFYTDLSLAEKMLCELKLPKDVAIMDPCCGSGIFLYAAKKHLS